LPELPQGSAARNEAQIGAQIEAETAVVAPAAAEAVAEDVDVAAQVAAAVVASAAVDTAEVATKQRMEDGHPARPSRTKARQSLKGRDEHRGLFLFHD